MTIQELGAEATHVRFSFWSCKHQEDKQRRSYLYQPKTTQQHLTTATITFTVTFSTDYLARNCQVLLNNFITYSAVLTLPPRAQFSKKHVFPTEPLEWTAQVSPPAWKPASPQRPCRERRPGPPLPLGPQAGPPAPLPVTSTRDPKAHSRSAWAKAGGAGLRVAPCGAESGEQSEQRSTVPAPDAERPQEAAGPPQEALPPPAPAPLGGRLPGARPLAARRDGCAGFRAACVRVGWEAAVRVGALRRHRVLARAERGVTVQLVCFP